MCGPRATTMIPVLSESSFADTAGSIATTILVKSSERLIVVGKVVYRSISRVVTALEGNFDNATVCSSSSSAPKIATSTGCV